MSMNALKEHLEKLPSGPVKDQDALVELLAPCWDEFEGSDSESMEAWKLERIEDVEWGTPSAHVPNRTAWRYGHGFDASRVALLGS